MARVFAGFQSSLVKWLHAGPLWSESEVDVFVDSSCDLLEVCSDAMCLDLFRLMLGQLGAFSSFEDIFSAFQRCCSNVERKNYSISLVIFLSLFEGYGDSSSPSSTPSSSSNISTSSVSFSRALIRGDLQRQAHRFMIDHLEVPEYFSNLAETQLYEPDRATALSAVAENFRTSSLLLLRIWNCWFRSDFSKEALTQPLQHSTSAVPAASDGHSDAETKELDSSSISAVTPSPSVNRQPPVTSLALLPAVLFTCAAYSLDCDSCQWCSRDSLMPAGDLLNRIVETLGDTSRERLLSDQFASLLTLLRTRLRSGVTGSDWKRCPSSRYVLEWLVLRGPVRFPALARHLHHLFPVILPLANDFEVRNRAIGLRCLLHVAQNVNPTELQWFEPLVVQVFLSFCFFRYSLFRLFLAFFIEGSKGQGTERLRVEQTGTTRQHMTGTREGSGRSGQETTRGRDQGAWKGGGPGAGTGGRLIQTRRSWAEEDRSRQ